MPIGERDYWNDDRYKPKSKNAPKWSWGVIGFILLALFASGLPIKLYNEITIQQEQKIRSYLQEREQYDLNPPREFKELHNKTVELYVIKQAVVDYLMSSANANTYHSEILSTYIEESNQMMSDLRPLMIEGLQKADLRYRIEQDGTLTYWVKDHYLRSLE
jgi:hypothetical protein